MIDIQAAVADGAGGFSIETVTLGEPEAGEVLLRMRASGLCHTDGDSLRWGRALILGHEGAGEVLRVGAGVSQFTPGDRVLLNWAIPCGLCFQCQRGKENICENRGRVPDERFRRSPNHSSNSPSPDTPARNTGSSGPGRFNASFSLGTMATHALVPEAAVLHLPGDIPFEIGAIVGCAVMTGFGSAVNAARVASGSSVVVLGCGAVGLSTLLGAVHCGAAQIIAVDVNPARLELATRFGATETLLADRGDHGLLELATRVKLRTGGRGAGLRLRVHRPAGTRCRSPGHGAQCRHRRGRQRH